MADPVAPLPQAPKELQTAFNTFVQDDLWRFASAGHAPEGQLRDYLKENPDVLKYSFTDMSCPPIIGPRNKLGFRC